MNTKIVDHDDKKDTIHELFLLNKELADWKYALNESSILAITDHKGIIQFANKKFCELSQYSIEELIGQDHRILSSGYHPKEFFRTMWKSIGTGRVWKGEIRNMAKDGSFYWVLTTIVPIMNEKGKPNRFISFRVDITEQKHIEAELQNGLRQDFDRTVKNLENGIFKMIRDDTGKIIYTMAAGKLLHQLGLMTETLRDKTPSDIFPKDIARYKQLHYTKAFEGNRVHYEIELDDKLLYVDVSPISHGDKVVELVGSVHDITELRSTQKLLQENQQLYQTLLQHNKDAVLNLDLQGNILYQNPAAEELLGYSLNIFQKTTIQSLMVDKYLSLNQECFGRALRGKLQNFDTALYRENRQIIHFNITYLPIFVDQQITGIYAIGKDITKQKRVQEINAFLAHHDELTKLLNRRGFEEKLTSAIKNADQNNLKLAVMYIDLDRFKNINDTLGHYIGDRLLEHVALRLNERAVDGKCIARMGGDEFMVLCPIIECDEESIHFAEEILACLKEPFFIEKYELFVTSSIGISIYPTNGENVVDLMKHADIALYKAKDLGRNNFQIYSTKMDLMSFQSFFLERDLRKALIQNEFIFHLQPRIDSTTKEMIGAEALIRWNHPTFGLIPPSEFIPIAEETGLIIPMGKWMKRRVCEQIVKWKKEGISVVPISINISAQRFLQKDFAESVRDIIEEYGVEGNLLEIEITENSLMKNEEYVIQTIHDLKELGIKIYIDDFGTGYSSFSYLKMFRLDGIKIDRSFIRNISCQSENAGITAAMIQLAQILKMDVIAEGVETVEELLFLQEQNCHQVQGFLYSMPVPVKEFQELLKNGI